MLTIKIFSCCFTDLSSVSVIQVYTLLPLLLLMHGYKLCQSLYGIEDNDSNTHCILDLIDSNDSVR